MTNPRIISARQPIANEDGTITKEWFNFFARLVGGNSDPTQLIIDESIDRQTDFDVGFATERELGDLAVDARTSTELPAQSQQLADAFLLASLGSDGVERVESTLFVPYHIFTGEVFTVPLYKQALSAMTIVVDGTLDVSGFLIEVS